MFLFFLLSSYRCFSMKWNHCTVLYTREIYCVMTVMVILCEIGVKWNKTRKYLTNSERDFSKKSLLKSPLKGVRFLFKRLLIHRSHWMSLHKSACLTFFCPSNLHVITFINKHENIFRHEMFWNIVANSMAFQYFLARLYLLNIKICLYLYTKISTTTGII